MRGWLAFRLDTYACNPRWFVNKVSVARLFLYPFIFRIDALVCRSYFLTEVDSDFLRLIRNSLFVSSREYDVSKLKLSMPRLPMRPGRLVELPEEQQDHVVVPD